MILPTANCLQPPASSLQPTAYSLFPPTLGSPLHRIRIDSQTAFRNQLTNHTPPSSLAASCQSSRSSSFPSPPDKPFIPSTVLCPLPPISCHPDSRWLTLPTVAHGCPQSPTVAHSHRSPDRKAESRMVGWLDGWMVVRWGRQSNHIKCHCQCYHNANANAYANASANAQCQCPVPMPVL